MEAPASGGVPASEGLGRDVSSVERRIAAKPGDQPEKAALAAKAKDGR